MKKMICDKEVRIIAHVETDQKTHLKNVRLTRLGKNYRRVSVVPMGALLKRVRAHLRAGGSVDFLFFPF